MEEYLQGDEWNMQGEEEQVVLIYFNNVTVLNLLVVFLFLFFFSRGWNTSRQACIEKNATDTYIQYTRHLSSLPVHPSSGCTISSPHHPHIRECI